VLARAAVRDCM